MASKPVPPEASTSTLWRLSSELRHANEALEWEVVSLRREVAARRLTHSSASSHHASTRGANSPDAQAGMGPADTAVTDQLAQLEAQLAHAARESAEKQAALAAAAAELLAAQAATAVADAGIASLTAQLQEQQAMTSELRSKLAAAQEQSAAVDAQRAAQEDMATRTAERVLALEARITELLRQAEAQAGQQSSGASVPALTAVSGASRPSSRGKYAGPASDSQELGPGPLSPLAVSSSQPYFTRVYSALLPPPSDVEAAQERQALQQEVARLASRLVAAEAELAEQLQQKQEALGHISAAQAEAASLRTERELLQEQAVSLQQKVSAWQKGSMLRGWASSAEVAVEATLQRSPSRRLARRVRELVGGRSPAGSSGSSRAASPVPERPLQKGLEAAALYRGTMPAGMPAPAEEGLEAPSPADQPPRPLQQSIGRVQRMAMPAAAKSSAELQVLEAQLQAALTAAAALRSRAADAEAAAQAVLDLHAAGTPAACPAVEPDRRGHARCQQTIEGLFAQVWRERLGRQRAAAEVGDLRQKLSGQAAGTGQGTDQAASDVELDEATLKALEEEANAADRLAGTIGHCKAHQEQLNARVQRLEQQLAQYNNLLAVAEGIPPGAGSYAAAPGQGSPTGGRAGSPRALRGPASSSPMQAALTVLQFKRAAEEAASLREQLRAAQAEVARTRRRERELRARYHQLQAKFSTLSAGLGTVQSLLHRQGLHSAPRRSSAGAPASHVSKAGKGAPAAGHRGGKLSAMQGDGSAAMAALSALLRSLQADGTANPPAVVSPQASDGVEVSPQSAGALLRGSPTAERRSDPLEQTEEGQEGQALSEQGQCSGGEQAAEESLDVEALLPQDGAGSPQGNWGPVPITRDDPATPSGPPAARAGASSIEAHWQQHHGFSAASTCMPSRIPLPSPVSSTCAKPGPLVCSTDRKPERAIAGSGPQPSPAEGSVAHRLNKPSLNLSSRSPSRGIKSLHGCGSHGPRTTMSSTRL